MLKKIRKGIKRFMNEKIETYKEVLATAENRLILGLIFVGTGVGLIASAYIHVTN